MISRFDMKEDLTIQKNGKITIKAIIIIKVVFSLFNKLWDVFIFYLLSLIKCPKLGCGENNPGQDGDKDEKEHRQSASMAEVIPHETFPVD